MIILSVLKSDRFFFQNDCVQINVLRVSDSFKKRKLNFEGSIFSPFWDNIRNAALRDGKLTKLPRMADRALWS